MMMIMIPSYEEMCYTSLVTVYSSHVEQECQEDYVKVGINEDSIIMGFKRRKALNPRLVTCDTNE